MSLLGLFLGLMSLLGLFLGLMFLFLIFYLIKINLYADVAFFNAKINFFIIILIVPSVTLAIFVS